MSANPSIILYDIPTRDPKHCWSWNAWKTRFLLNFKGLDYVTEWTEYSDIKPKLIKDFPNNTHFIIPTIRLPNGECVMDSKLIAARLEADYPEPPAHPESPYVDRLLEQMRLTLGPLQQFYIYMVPKRLLSEKSIADFTKKREADIGMTLEEFYNRAGDNTWDRVSIGLRSIAEMLKEHPGPFFMGETVSYADFIWAGFLLFLGDLGEDMFEKCLEMSGDDGKAYQGLLEAVKPWSGRNAH